MASRRKNIKKTKASIRKTNRNKMLDSYKKNKISKNLGKLGNQQIKPPSLNAINAQKSSTVYNVMSDVDNEPGGNCHCKNDNECHNDCSNAWAYCTDDDMCYPVSADYTRFEWWSRPRLNYTRPGHDGNGLAENFQYVRIGATPASAYHFCKSKGCDDWYSYEWRHTGWCQTGSAGPACCPQNQGGGMYQCHCSPGGNAWLSLNACTNGASPPYFSSDGPCPDSSCGNSSAGTDFWQPCICGATNCDDYEFGNYPYADENYLTEQGYMDCSNNYGTHTQDNCINSGEVMISGDPTYCHPLYGNWGTNMDGSWSGMWISPKLAYHWTDTRNNCGSCDLGAGINRGYEHGNCRHSHHWRYCYNDPDPIFMNGEWINNSYCNDTYYDAPTWPSEQQLGTGEDDIDYDTADGFCFRYDETAQISGTHSERVIWKITCMGGDQCYHGRGMQYQDKEQRRGGLISTPQPMKVGGKVKRTKMKSKGNGIEFSS